MSTQQEDAESQFIHELEVFRKEADSALQFLYTFLAINAILSKDKQALRAVNKTPLFWKTTLGALQTAFFIVLGRVFDYDSRHNIGAVLRMAQNNRDIFSKVSLAGRKRRMDSKADGWLEEFLESVYEPKPTDFRRLRGHVLKYRRIYEMNYRDLRRKVFAHKELSDEASIAALYAKTNIRELERLSVFLIRMHDALWQLVFNGRKPTLRNMRSSVRRIGDAPLPEWRSHTIHERTVSQVHTFFALFRSAAQPGTAGVARKAARP